MGHSRALAALYAGTCHLRLPVGRAETVGRRGRVYLPWPSMHNIALKEELYIYMPEVCLFLFRMEERILPSSR